ncbi:hypothetical protein A5784_16990 [Mycobacterium sp. 852013-50091_SCH5140682]|nr:hypothetical protein [Mycobacterium sp. 852013-50091_SCH5140682]OBC01802.1 hypothetical protein A5784_16990 [Mycobacterium sp. 852013-50091_SCH5140682]
MLEGLADRRLGRLRQCILDPSELPLQNLCEEAALSREVPVDRLLAHAELLREAVHARAAKAIGGEQSFGCIECQFCRIGLRQSGNFRN